MDVRNERLLSTVNVPVAISMANVERQLNAQVTGLIYEDNSLDDKGGDGFMAKVWKRGPITVQAGTSAKDSVFHFRVPLKIWARAGVKVLGFWQSKETEFTLDLKFATRVSLDPDWSLSTQTTAEGYDWVQKPTTRFVGFEVPVTRWVAGALDKNMGSITTALDQQVRQQVDLRTPVLQAWNLLRQPYLLSEQYRTWLLVVPRRVLITPLRFEGRMVRATIGIEGNAVTSTGAKPNVAPAVTLPNVAVVSAVPDDFRVNLLSEVPYTEAAQLATQAFKGKTYTFGGYSVSVTDIDLYGQNDQLIIKAGLAGSVDGHIYLKGRPVYDPATQSISLADLTYDLETRNLLQKAASWLLQGTFARKLREGMTIPVGPQLAQMQQAVQARLAGQTLRPGVKLNGKITAVQPEGVYLTPTALITLVQASGQVDVNVEGLQ